MQIKKKAELDRDMVSSRMRSILSSRLNRIGYRLDHSLEYYHAYAYIDGPITFAIVVSPDSDQHYTGWSKFNANDNNYEEITGLCLALQRAVAKLISAEAINVPAQDFSKCYDSSKEVRCEVRTYNDDEGTNQATLST